MAISKSKREAVYQKYDGHCAYCGRASHEWNDGEKDRIYCLGLVDPMTDCPIPECLACPDFVDKAQDDLETFYGWGLTMDGPKKPFYRDKKWKLGGSFGWWHIPYCPHCKRQLGLMVEEQKAEKCPMCGEPLEWGWC